MSDTPARPRCSKPMRGQKACGRPAGHSGAHYSEEAWQRQNSRVEEWRREGRYPVRTHSSAGYNRGCRCEECTAAHAKRAREERAAGRDVQRAAGRLESGAEVVIMTGWANGNSFGASMGNDARPVPDWSPRSVPTWKLGLRQSDDRGSI